MDGQDVMVNFLHTHGPQKNFKWPRNPEICLVPAQNILCTISTPVKTTGCIYNISYKEYDTILKSYQAFFNSTIYIIIRVIVFAIIVEKNKVFN